jgi:GxxExxY protein
MEKNRNKITEAVIGCAIEVHRALGPGLLESAYQMCLCRELVLRGIEFKCQCAIPLNYKGTQLDCGYRADLIVADTALVEVKAVDELIAIHDAQLLSYLKLTRLKVGLLINFNVRVLTHGIRRKVIGEPAEVSLSNSVTSVISVVK